MRFLFLTILLGLYSSAAHHNHAQSTLLQQNPYSNYYNQPLQYNQISFANLGVKSHNHQSNTSTRELSLSMNPTEQLPDNIQLQKLLQNFSQTQAMNPRTDAKAADLNEEINPKPKVNRALKTYLVNRYDTRRYLENEEGEGEKQEEEHKNEGSEENSLGETSGDIPKNDVDSVDGYIDRLMSRVKSIDDKVDHLLFHNHHDLAGVTAHYTPYGIQMLPSKKSADSVDQKLKMVDYMHNIGGGYNPMLHTMLPYYLGHDDKNNSGIKMNGYLGMGMGTGARKKKVL